MTMRKLPKLAVTATLLLSAAFSGEVSASSVEVALFGEPPTLDPMLYTSDAASTIDQHIYETLYTFDSKWQVAPLLASALPTLSDGGKIVSIPLRTDPVFHNGSKMTADDVIASLKRWTRVSSRGKLAGDVIESITSPKPDLIEIKLKTPFAPLLPLLASNNAAAAVMPKALTETDQAVTEIIGTGPYKLLERKPAQYTRVVRFDEYKSPTGAPDGYAGERKVSIDEVRFIPVTNAATRVAGVISGQYAFAEVLPNESYAQLQSAKGVKPILVTPTSVTFMVLNTKGGQTANPKIRLAMQAAMNPADMLTAAFGDPKFFQVDGSIFGKGTLYYAPDQVKGYNAADTKKAAQLLKEAGYSGKPIRLLTSTQFDYFYKQTLVMKNNLEEAGFKVDVQVSDWASVMQKRTGENEWEGFIASHSFTPEPSLLTFMSPTYPGWWDTPEKRKALDEFNSEVDPNKRVERWKAVQSLLYEQASTLISGQFFALIAVSDKLQGFYPSPWASFWNVKLAD